MKIYTKLFAVAAIFLVSACSKDTTQGVDLLVDPTVLTGKWKLSEIRNDIGDGKSQWEKVDAGTEKYVVFNKDSTLSGNNFSNYPVYSQKDPNTLMFKEADGIKYQNYRYELKDGKLSMSPAGPVWCIEACGARYIKVE
jgi:hypothetical protein